MPTSSVRRLKERGGGGAKITAAASTKHPKSLTPQSEKPILSNGRESLKRSTGKENPRPTSRARAAMASAPSQKPIMKAMPRIDKASAVNGSLNGSAGVENRGEVRVEGRPRWSTSSAMVPSQRGRSPSPSDFNRGFLGSKSSRAGSAERKRGNSRGLTERECEKSELGKCASKNYAKSCEIGDGKVGNLSSGSEKFNLVDADEMLNSNGNEKMKSCVEKGVDFCGKELKSARDSGGGELSVKGSSKENKTGNLSGLLKEKEAGELNTKDQRKSGGFSGSLKGKEGNEDKRSSSSVNVKYPSKLHEKLAFLEGKVKRIASDIKKTKEMLDMNNPDSSKMILSDIQEKISGIEKAMCHVVSNDDTKANLVESYGKDDAKIKPLETRQEIKVDEGKSSVKGLNADELEARLFPHHKLLRDRTSLKPSCGSAQSHDIEIADARGDLNEEEKSVSPVEVEEHPIAMEFLASLSNEQYVGATRVGTVPSEICDVQETDGAVTKSENNRVSDHLNGKGASDIILTADERIEEFDDQENMTSMIIEEDTEDSFLYQLNDVGRKTTTGGWFVSEGESVLLAHDDGSCSFYDIINCEV